MDLLVSLAYSAASTNSLQGFPDGLDLQIFEIESSSLVDFDSLSEYKVSSPANLNNLCLLVPPQKNDAVMKLLNMLPSVTEMKTQLEKKQKGGTRKLSLGAMNPLVPAAAWQLLRWFVRRPTS